MTLTGLKEKLSQADTFSQTLTFSEPMDGVLDIHVPSLPSMPIHVTIEDNMMNVWNVIAHVEDIPSEKIDTLNHALLLGNGIADLSNFCIIEGAYCLKGDLSSTSTFENLVLELETLIDTTESAVQDIFLPVLKG